GLMYANGEGVPDDNMRAYAWFSIAAAQGEYPAKENKESVAERMTRAQIDEAQKLSREYWDAYGPGRHDQ
ncbi:MAG: SEL1-like repeat protein, partial [Gammaproteobacteria bacterium]|nr:SEL1-like repeat protein [Gammaproteobacteria bacterium]